MQRRTFLLGSTALIAVSGLGLAAGKALHTYDLATLLQQLQAFRGKEIKHSGAWSASEVFQHCAQSIAGSLDGYPEQKSPLFQLSIGKLALSTFQAAGAMRHPLAEPIPGMAVLNSQLPTAQALELLISQLERFLQNTDEMLQPHFAYGTLSKSNYQAAHWLHISQHLSELTVT
ncbi:DUF1569 domain-containing protein [Rheinheimera riviphila]|uniref:DUF1569 domain-containing protein n=1 Tax=Rheinheimera riviphila TaxID=1834037 RepID=A0A437R5D7_9GAMM|nr:DUF1569 domain-containing protein [Rheinheimera riviphila]RVU41984.1 DUF1569 domain-containing protein [Rheinheimera riviphila]